jgi:hypothetical protein
MDSIARRSASARPSFASRVVAPTAVVMSFTVAHWLEQVVAEMRQLGWALRYDLPCSRADVRELLAEREH